MVEEYLDEYLTVKFPGFEDLAKNMDPIQKLSWLFLFTSLMTSDNPGKIFIISIDGAIGNIAFRQLI